MKKLEKNKLMSVNGGFADLFITAVILGFVVGFLHKEYAETAKDAAKTLGKLNAHQANRLVHTDK